jgi:hypothetical protein
MPTTLALYGIKFYFCGMKNWICIVWILLVVAQAGYQGIVCAYYAFQKEQITNDFCINKSRPALKCNGKCHLKNMLAAGEDTDSKDAPNPIKEIQLKPLIGLLQPLITLSSLASQRLSGWYNRTSISGYINHYNHLAAFELLDPPQDLTPLYS